MPISFTRATWVDYVGPTFLQASEVNRLETAIDALINGTSRAVYRDGDTITGNLTVNGWIEGDQGFRDAGGVTRISATGAGVFSQATVSDVAATRVMFGGAAGRVVGVADLTYDDTTKVLTVGSSALATNPRVSLDSAAGQTRYVRIRTGTASRWAFGGGNQAETGSDTGTDFELLAVNDAGATSTVLSVVRAAGGPATLSRPLVLSTHSADRLLTTGASGTVTSDAGLTRLSVSGVTRILYVGDAAVAGNVGIFARRTAGYSAGFYYQDPTALANRWSTLFDGTMVWTLNSYDSASALIDSPLSFANASGGAMTFGGSTLRPATFTGTIQANGGYKDAGGVTRVSSTGAGVFTTASTSGMGTFAQATVSDLTANLPVYADATKKLATESASAFRSRISAQAQDAKLDAISAGETAGRFWLGSYSAAINSYGMTSSTGKARFGNGVFLAIGDVRTNLLRSTDFGATWTTVSPINGANTFSDVCWHSAASLWVAVGPSTCATSPDGVTWTMRTISADTWNGLASNGTTIIAVGAGCKVAYSTNGTSWTTVTPAGIPAAGFYSACWSSVIGKFLAIGSGNVSISSNGSTWSTIANPGAGGGNWCSPVANNFVAVDSSSGPYWSVDGVTWGTPRRTPSAKANWQAIATNGAVAVIGGYSEETQAVSSDGEVWLPVDMGYTGSFNAVAYGGGWFVMLDDLGYCFRSRG